MKIAFVGIPCSGKTTTGKLLAHKLGYVFIPEVARVLINARGRPPTQDDQNFIMRMQSCLEDSMRSKNMVCDVPMFINNLYYRYYFGKCAEERELYSIARKHSYDLIFKLSPLEYRNDGIRYQTEEDLNNIDKMIDSYQNHFGDFVYIEPTDITERMNLILEEVKRYETISSTSAKDKA